MKALTWHGKRDVRVETVPDPAIREADDIVIRVTSSGVCGSDLHLYEVMSSPAGRRRSGSGRPPGSPRTSPAAHGYDAIDESRDKNAVITLSSGMLKSS